jgi:hypothetical protein
MAFAMKREIMDTLSDARDFYALTRGVLAMCEPFGPVHSFKLVHNRGASRVACLIELESAQQQPALARALGGRAINGSVCLEIPVHHDFEKRSAVVALAPQPVPAEARAAVL